MCVFFCFTRRASEFRITYGDMRTTHDDVDTFEHILNVTSHNEALLAYYYLDSENKVIILYLGWYGIVQCRQRGTDSLTLLVICISSPFVTQSTKMKYLGC